MSWESSIVEHKEVPADELLANPHNWRIHKEQQTAAIAALLDETGWAKSVVVNIRTGHIVDGHARVALAVERGSMVPVEYIDVSEEQELRLLALLDPLAEMAGKDKKKLEQLLAKLEDGDPVLDGMLDEMRQRDKAKGEKTKVKEQDTSAQLARGEYLRQQWGTAVGQLWELPSRHEGMGHLLYVGDCTDVRSYEALLGGEEPNGCVLDFPYGVGVQYDSFTDDEASVVDLLGGALPLLMPFAPLLITPGIPMMWHYPKPDWIGAWMHTAAMSSSVWGFVNLNPILFYGRDPYQVQGKGRRPSALVMNASSGGSAGHLHPVPKPLPVWEWCVERISPNRGEILLDVVAGAGTTAVACENVGRSARMMEISPNYSAAILQRYLDHTGLRATLVN